MKLGSSNTRSSLPLGLGALLALALAVAIALLLLLTGHVGGSATGGVERAEAGCGALKVKSSIVTKYSKTFAAQYKKKIRVDVSHARHAVRNWRVELYTFGGFLIGKSDFDEKLDRDDRAAIKLRLAIQPGQYTLVTKGEVRGCGLIERNDVVSFRSCISKLPIKFVGKPGGVASDYGKYVSVKIEPNPIFAPVTDIRSTISSFDGDVFGKARLPAGHRKLIGTAFLDHKLKAGGLLPGGYTVFVTGKARQPKECGDLSKSTKLRFQ